MRINNIVIIVLLFISFSFNSCKKDENDVFKCRVVSSLSKEPLRQYPVRLLEETSSYIGGTTYKTIEEKYTDNNGYVVFTKEKYKSSGFMDSEPTYDFQSGYENNIPKDTTHKFFGHQVDVSKNGEVTLEVNPRGYIKLFIDEPSFSKYYFNSSEISTKYGSKNYSVEEFKEGIIFYTTPNQTTEFKFKLKALFFDTLITRNIYVKDYNNPDGSGSSVSYILTK